MRCICWLQKLLEGRGCVAENHEPNDPEQEIWRSCQKSVTLMDGCRLMSAAGWRPHLPPWSILLKGFAKSWRALFCAPQGFRWTVMSGTVQRTVETALTKRYEA